MTVEQRSGEPLDQFPVGMRVLAVDDNPTCLCILERLLRQCQYHVTATNQAMTALKLLRENKNKFDLVISDVEMPDMDGFKLLELVGLEMDLPVIMLSGHSDPKFVMKGITHGACDYLLKPVRIEELKNIWQHVVRRRKFDKKKRSYNSDSKDCLQSGTGNDEAAGTGNSDMNDWKLNKRRKEQSEDEEDENEHENEETSTQKKPRVVWSVDLHRKFVAAVNQLGIDKAVPKKILDLMNVEKLTRENVASHLQKYRLYLKRISCVANQQASMAAVLTDPHYLAMSSSLNNLDSFHRTMTVGSGQFQRLGSYPSNGMLSRLNSPAGLGVRGLSSSGMFLQNANDSGNFQPVMLPSSHNTGGNILQGTSVPLGLDQLQSNNNKGILGNPTAFPAQNPLINVPNNLLVLEGHPQQTSPRGTSLPLGFSSRLLGDQNNRRLDNWSGAVSSTLHLTNTASQNGNSNSSNQFDVSSMPSPVPNSIQLQRSRTDTTQEWNVHNSSMNYPIPFGSDYPNSRILSRNVDFDLNGQSGFLDSSGMKQSTIVGTTADALLSKEGYLLTQQKQQTGFIGSDAGSLDDIVNSMVKQEQNQTDVSGGDLGFNAFGSFRTCM